MTEDQQTIDSLISTMVGNFLYYDRKEDEDVGHIRIAKLLNEVGIGFVAGRFVHYLFSNWPDWPSEEA